jgi:hypothetical protein
MSSPEVERRLLCERLGAWYSGREDGDYWEVGPYRIRRTLKDKDNVERAVFFGGHRVETCVDFLEALEYVDQQINMKEGHVG